MKKKILACVFAVFLCGCGNTLSNDAEPTATPRYGIFEGTGTEETISISCDDYEIPAIVRTPDAEFDTVVILVHGFGSNKECGGMYTLFSEYLADNSTFATIRFDFTGCGDSTRDFSEFNFTTGENELLSVVNYINTVYPGVTIDVVGHSMGGTISMYTSGNNPTVFSHVVTWNGAVDLSVVYEDDMLQEGMENGFCTRYIDWIGKDVTFGKQFFEDVENTDLIAVFSDYHGLVYAIGSDADATVDWEYAQQVAEAGGNDASWYEILEGSDHTFNVTYEEDLATFAYVEKQTADFLNDSLVIEIEEESESAQEE